MPIQLLIYTPGCSPSHSFRDSIPKCKLGYCEQEGAKAKDAAMSTWLQQNDLLEYREDFSKAGIGQDMLALLGDEELRQMGIVTLGPRRRILAAIQATQVMLLSCQRVPALQGG